MHIICFRIRGFVVVTIKCLICGLFFFQCVAQTGLEVMILLLLQCFYLGDLCTNFIGKFQII